MRTVDSINSALQVAIWRRENSKHRFVRPVHPTESIQAEFTSLLMEIQIQRLIHGSVASSLVAPMADPIARNEANQANVLRPILEVFETIDLSSERL